MDILEPQHVTV